MKKLGLIAAGFGLAVSATALAEQPLNVSSGAFENGKIPAKYTCDGAGKSPPLTWSNLPAGTKSVAIVVDDPDAPNGTFVHWLVFDLPAGTTSIAEGALPAGAGQGKNSKGQTSWTPPCPPNGTHHYHFKVYALDRSLSLSEPTETDVDRAIKGHVLAKGELVATYSR
jgi:Raf kinase inhibitor-like YbhB/YbcL family protein